jgi:hypothetical protein
MLLKNIGFLCVFARHINVSFQTLNNEDQPRLLKISVLSLFCIDFGQDGLLGKNYTRFELGNKWRFFHV